VKGRHAYGLLLALFVSGSEPIDECTGTYVLTTSTNVAGETEVYVTLLGQKHTESSEARMSIADSTYQLPSGIKMSGTILEVDTDIRREAFSILFRWKIAERYQCLRTDVQNAARAGR